MSVLATSSEAPRPDSPRVGAEALLRLAVPPAGAEVWLLALPEPGAPDTPLENPTLTAEFENVLSPAERERRDAFRRPADRLRYGAAHAALRVLLGARLQLPPDTLAFDRDACPCCDGPHGRPVLAGTAPGRRPVEFSLSHGGDAVLIALAATPVGVDVEHLPRAGTVTEVSPHLHPAERAHLAAAADPIAAFAQVWTRKEAYLKGLGTGLGRALDADDVATPPGPPGWTVLDLPLPPPLAATHAAAAAFTAPV